MFANVKNTLLNKRSVKLITKYYSLNQNKVLCQDEVDKSQVLVKFLGVSKSIAKEIIKDNVRFKRINKEELQNSIQKLKEFNFQNKDIIEKSKVLLASSVTLENRFNILKECGVTVITLNLMEKYIMYMNKSIRLLSLHNVIPPNVNVSKLLASHLNLNISSSGTEETVNNLSLNLARRQMLDLYLKKKFSITDIEIQKLNKTYVRIKHRSFKSILSAINILENALNYKTDRIIRNGFLLYADPNNILKILNELPTIAGIDAREVLYKRPKLIMYNCDHIKKVIEVLNRFNIPDSSLARCLDILTLSHNTVLERLNHVSSVQEFNVLLNNPRLVRLLHYQNKAISRLDYLKQSKIKCASLHILSANSEIFEKYAREGTDKTRGCDIVKYLCSQFRNESQDTIRNVLMRHPNWCHIPLIAVENSFEYLKKNLFNLSDIFTNLHLILYPMEKIEIKLNLLKKNEIPNFNFDYDRLEDSQALGLCLYFIELEFHFTGDGIWTDMDYQSNHNIEPSLIDATSYLEDAKNIDHLSPLV